ncbi:protein SFI1 homolog [Mya arenaria]|uniref:protein SFI1 homolog n=1 Tax=Mya arenaria TaxID=6604 RepID=UPI0022E2C9D2|nr:protein SFI1 homolog [Mya arenaria]
MFKMEPNVKNRQAVLRDLGNHLQVKAEKMRLLARAEDGLGDGDYNPYSTHELDADAVVQSTYRKQTKPDIAVLHDDPSPLLSSVRQTHDSHLSSARQKRRVKKTKQVTVDIKHYRPGYTWNRGGRMKEIRIRHLARKYVRLWKRKVFGRVTPSQARHHYQRRLLRGTFRVWHLMWWELRREWRLVVRAECHFRFVQCQKVYRAWKMFIVQRRIRNAKTSVAEHHASKKLLQKAFSGWQEYVESRRDKSQANRAALSLQNTNVLRRCWARWVERYDVALHRQHMGTVALQFWAYRIQAQYWLVWQAKLNERRAGVMKYYRAVRHHNTTVVSRCFRALVQHWNHRAQKKQKKLYAERLYLQGLVEKSFRVWLSALEYRQMVHERQDRITSLAATFQKRRAFSHWRHYIILQRETYDAMAVAENHHRLKLLRLGFSAFRLCVVQKHLKVMRNKMADQFRYKHLLEWGWLTWLERCENKEELKMVTQSHAAWIFYRRLLLRKCFYQLQDYTEWRKHRQAQYARADAHFYMTEMPKYLFRIRVFVQLQKNERENMEKCEEFRTENLLARFFYLWVKQNELSREDRVNTHMAILHCEGKVKRQFFTVWKHKTTDALQEDKSMEFAAAHYHKELCRKHLLAWKGYIDFLKKSQQQAIEAARYHSRQIMKKCLIAWKQFTLAQRDKHRKQSRADKHHARKVCGRMVGMWLHYVDTQRAINARVEVMYQRKSQQLLRDSFHTWQDNVTLQKYERGTEGQAERHHTLHVLAKVFTAWHRYSAIHAYKKSETRQWVASAREHLDTKVLQLYFDSWREHHSEHVDMRMKIGRAVSHHGNQVKVKVMQQWILFTKESVRKKLLRKQSDWFNGVRLTTWAFSTWRSAHSRAVDEASKSGLALWHWSLMLNRKVLIGWYTYILERQEKKHRIACAMERRRSRLVRNGLSQWLRVADDMANMRKTFAVQQQAKSAYETYQVALRCGLHWKTWASKKWQSRGNKKPGQSRDVTLPASKHKETIFSGKGNNQSTSTTPRFPASLFNTPRDYGQLLTSDVRAGVPAPASRDDPQLAVRVADPPKMAVSPRRVKTVSQGRGQLRSRPRQPDFMVASLKRAGLFVHDNKSQMPTDANNQTSCAAMETDPAQNAPEIEKLNLSLLTSQHSEAESGRQLSAHSDRVTSLSQQTYVPVTQRSDISSVSETWNKLQRPFENYQGTMSQGYGKDDLCDGDRFLSENIQGGHLPAKGQQLSVITDMIGPSHLQAHSRSQEGWSSVVPQVTKADKPTLMTPADFFAKPTAHTTKGAHSVASIATPRSVVSNFSYAPSECLSTVTTPRILCDNTDHNHPLSETRSFRVNDFQEQITPRSASGSFTPREQIASLGFEACSAEKVSTKSLQKEIVVIRNRLKSFEQKKKKLRTMQKQLKQLSDWLREVEERGQGSEDDDVINARQEVTELGVDVRTLKQTIDTERPVCGRLVEQVKSLTAQLSGS